MPRGGPNQRRIKFDFEKAKVLFAEPLTQKEIAKHLGIGYRSLLRWAPQFGLKRTRSASLTLAYTVGRRTPELRKKRQRFVNNYVYILKPEHPETTKQGYILEHRLVWEQVHNMPLPAGYIIHHLNGVKTDNRPQNLVALSSSKHNSVLAEKARRIRELEIENRQLRQALEQGQMILGIGDN